MQALRAFRIFWQSLPLFLRVVALRLFRASGFGTGTNGTSAYSWGDAVTATGVLPPRPSSGTGITTEKDRERTAGGKVLESFKI